MRETREESPETASPKPGAADSAESGGLFGSLRRLFLHALEMLQLRVDMLSVELEAEKLRLFSALVQALMALLLAVAALGLFSAGVLLLSPEPWRWLAALLLGAGYALLAWWCWRRASANISQKGGAFAGTVAELARDREALGG
nr:phage holin family protein [uncultured Roseateles sp.]